VLTFCLEAPLGAPRSFWRLLDLSIVVVWQPLILQDLMHLPCDSEHISKPLWGQAQWSIHSIKMWYYSGFQSLKSESSCAACICNDSEAENDDFKTKTLLHPWDAAILTWRSMILTPFYLFLHWNMQGLPFWAHHCWGCFHINFKSELV
jgi:hypothetical protein